MDNICTASRSLFAIIYVDPTPVLRRRNYFIHPISSLNIELQLHSRWIWADTLSLNGRNYFIGQ